MQSWKELAMTCWHCGVKIDEGDTCEVCQDDGFQYPSEAKLERMEERDEQE